MATFARKLAEHNPVGKVIQVRGLAGMAGVLNNQSWAVMLQASNAACHATCSAVADAMLLCCCAVPAMCALPLPSFAALLAGLSQQGGGAAAARQLPGGCAGV